MEPLVTLRVGDGRPADGYRLADGSKPLSASQIADALDAPDKRKALFRWYAYEGRHAFRIAEEARQVGSAVHKAIEAHYLGLPPEPALWDSPDQTAADTCFAAFLDWHARTTHTPLLLEWPLVSERLRLAGTLDMLAVFDGPEIVDMKTSKRLSPRSMFLQCAVYDLLITAELPDMPPRVGARIVRLPKDGTGYRETRCDGASWAAAQCAALSLVEAMRMIAAVDGLRELPALEPVDADAPITFDV
ncbi:MAG TPA: PD-(D/E)XK nuclease family protein [Thermoleophilia bacterium]|nr:PD-(D/E)XK nuclease family protein [Thermoleophilia bacterium]